jgi:hypothetical protein
MKDIGEAEYSLMFYSKRLNVAVLGVQYKKLKKTSIVDIIDLTGKSPKFREKRGLIGSFFIRSFILSDREVLRVFVVSL